MAQLKTALSKLNAEALVAKASYVISQLTAHAATFTAPNPALAALTTAKNTLADAITAAMDGGKSAHQAKRDAKRELKDMLTAEAGYVASVANGDAQTILDGGFDVRNAAKPSTLPEAPVKLEARLTGNTGTVDLDWQGLNGVRLYHVYMTDQDPASPTAAWELTGVTTKSRHVIEGLESYKAYWFKVAAINVVGEGPASDVLMGRAA